MDSESSSQQQSKRYHSRHHQPYQQYQQRDPAWNSTTSSSSSTAASDSSSSPSSSTLATLCLRRSPAASTPGLSPASSISTVQSRCHAEPASPIEERNLLTSSSLRNMTISSSITHRPAASGVAYSSYPSSSTDPRHYQDHHPHHRGHPSEGSSHPWSEGMKGIFTSLTGAPPSKSRSPISSGMTKPETYEPARPSEVEAATSVWDIPRDTVAMTMGFQGSYEDQHFGAQPVWQQQQQQQQQQPQHHHQHHQQAQHHSQQQHQQLPTQSQMPSYQSNAVDHTGQFNGSSYSNPPAPSGMAGASAGVEAARARSGTDGGMLADRQPYARRSNYVHVRPGEAATDASNGAQWWPSTEQNQASAESADDHYASVARRSNHPPPLPETRSTNRPAWNGPSGFEMGGYEFPQSNLGKRQYEDEGFAANAGAGGHSGLTDPNDLSSRRYSLAPNMIFSRPSAPISGLMNNYRSSAASDPRRPSLPSDPFGAQPQHSPTAGRGPYASSSASSSQWSPWGASSSHPSGMSVATSSTSSNPSWRDNSARYGSDAATASPNGMVGVGGMKRHGRDRSSSAASAAQQTNILANTPFHITTDIVLRAPPGSKMEDVYYDQHCEMQTGMPDPPPSDFEVENEEDRPRLQTDKLRFPGDLYTPRWVRGSGNAREAWCDRCESGNWLQLKNSQYWYDQVHKHGISSVSGLRFTAPTQLKVYADAAGTVEGKCHQCKEWVLICTAKRRRNFAAFFKHAHACHSYRKASAVGNGPIIEHNPGGHRNKKGINSPPA